jgi:hypothetical protein
MPYNVIKGISYGYYTCLLVLLKSLMCLYDRFVRQYGDRLERGLEEMRNDLAFEEYNKNKPW